MRGAIARLRRRTLGGLPVVDLALAAVLCIVAVVSVLTGNPDEGPLAVTMPVAVVTTLALAVRRTAAPVTIALIVVAGTAQTVLAQTPGSLWSLAVYVIAMYSVAAWSTEATAATAGAVFVVALLVQERLASGVDYVFILLLFCGVWLLGRAGRHWRGRVTTAERRQREAGRLAAAEERLRIARDLHDVVAHSLGAIAVQADAAEAALHAAPDRALAPVQAIRATAREALAEIRDMLDVLRDDDERQAEASGIEQIPRLVDAARASGMTVALEQGPTGGLVSAATGTACYRIVQEALTNARRHAPGAAVVVTVASTRDGVLVRVVNGAPPGAVSPIDASPAGVSSVDAAARVDGRPGAAVPSGADASGSADPRPGYGIRGMRERIAAVGGALTAAATADGGFDVRAELPLHPLPAPEATA